MEEVIILKDIFIYGLLQDCYIESINIIINKIPTMALWCKCIYSIKTNCKRATVCWCRFHSYRSWL